MAKSTFSLLGIFLLITIATAAVVTEPISHKNVTKRSVAMNTIKKIGGDALDAVDGAFDFLGRLLGVKSKAVLAPVPPNNMDDLREAISYQDAKKVSDLLLRDNFFNREIVATRYFLTFWSDIKSDIRASFSGEYRDLLLAFVEDKYGYLAQELYDGIFGISSGNIYAGLDVLCNSKADEVALIAQAYRSKFGRELITDLSFVPDPSIRASLMRFARGQKISYYGFNPMVAELSGYPRDHAYFNELLCTTNGPRFFAERLHSSLTNGDYRSLTRLIITLINHNGYETVLPYFQSAFGQSLMDVINFHTDGPYNYALWVIIDMASSHELLITDGRPYIVVQN